MKRLCIHLVSLFLLGIVSLQAQNTAGTDFWVTFGRNELSHTNSTQLSLHLRIVSRDLPAQGFIYFNSTNQYVNFDIGPRSVFNHELTSTQRNASYNEFTTPTITDRSIYIHSDQPITAYALNQTNVSADATNLLPVPVFGTDYFQISYQPANSTNARDAYAVIATEDDTRVYHNGILVGDALQAGDVYYRTNSSDMTGSRITSDKPIAFFSCNNGAMIPLNEGSRDCLMQQLAPVNTWGNNFFVPVTNKLKDRVRIIASVTGTVITQTGAVHISAPGGQTGPIYTLDLGTNQYIELEVTGNGCFIEADNPIGVCTYMVCRSYTGTPNDGDPAIAWLPSVEQTATDAMIARFHPASGTALSPNKHYALIIVPSDAKNQTLVTQGSGSATPITDVTWFDNTYSSRSFCSYNLLTDQSYRFTNPEGIIVMGYGKGDAESYYYLGYSSMRNLEAFYRVNDIYYTELEDELICEHEVDINAVFADIESLDPNPGHLKWYIGTTEYLPARDLLEWSYTFSPGQHTINMEAHFADGSMQNNFVGTLNIGAVFSASTNLIIGGTVSPTDTCVKTGEPVTFNAIASPAYIFVNWTLNGVPVETNPVWTFTASEDLNLVANFELNTVAIELSVFPDDSGTVTGEGEYDVGDNITVMATPNSTYTFKYWTEFGMIVSYNAAYNFDVERGRELVAHFELITYTVTLWKDPGYAGDVTGNGTYTINDEVTIEATPNALFTFIYWTDENNVIVSANPYTFDITANRTFTAHFVRRTYTVTTSENPWDGGTTSGGATDIQYGTWITVSAVASPRFTFESWTENGVVVSTLDDYSFPVGRDRKLVANFVADTYSITLEGDPWYGGLPTGVGYNIEYGTYWTVHANPTSIYRFLYWTDEDDIIVSIEDDYSFFVEESRHLTAHYELITFRVTVEPIPTEGGTATGGGNFIVYGTITTVLASANPLYRFIDWTVDGIRVSTSEEYSFAVTEDRHLVANFELITCWVNLIPYPDYGGWVEGGGNNIPFAEEITIYAYPFPEYYFVGWAEEDGTFITAQDVYTFPVTESRTLIAHFEPIELDVILWTTPGGTVSPNGYNIVYGDWFTANAYPNPTYNFVNWTEDDEEVYTLPEYSFPVIRSRVLTANFELKTYNIYVSAEPPTAGTVSGGGTNIPHGTEISLMATAGECAHFVNWTENGIIVCVDPVYPITVTGDRNLVAHFAFDTFTVNLSANPTEGGTPAGGGTDIFCQTEITVSANPEDCYIFLYWIEDGLIVSSEEDYTFIVTGDRNLVAHYSIKEYEINLFAQPSSGGTVTGGGTQPCEEEITVLAIPQPGFRFVKWTEYGMTLVTTPDYTFTVNRDRDLVAHFEQVLYTITVTPDPTPGGLPIEAGAHIVYGTEWTLEARPSSIYDFVYWSDDNGFVSNLEIFSFTVTESRNFVAHYALKKYDLVLEASPAGGGTAEVEGVYEWGTVLTVTATPNAAYDFIKWTNEDGSFITHELEYAFMVVGNRHLIAHFELKKFTVTLFPNPSEGGIVDGGGTDIPYNTEIEILATPNYNYYFYDWTEEDGTLFAPDSLYGFPVTRDLVLYAYFFPQTYNIITSANWSAGGSVTPSMYNVPFDTVVTLIAEAYPNYVFVDWTEEILPDFHYLQEEYTFPVHRSRNLVANFALQTFNIHLTAEPDWGGNVSGGGNFDYNTTITVSAAPEPDYVFVEWRENGVFVDHDPNYSFSVICSRNLTAIFRLDSVNVVVIANPEEGGTVMGGGTGFHYGEMVTVSAFPDDCYTFLNWTVDGVVVATTPDYTFPAIEHITLVAHFEIKKFNVILFANPIGGGTVSGGDINIDCGDEITIEAFANECYSFVNWILNGSVFSSDSSFTFEVTEDMEIVAHFAPFPFDITLTADPITSGTVSGNMALTGIDCGTEITVTATPVPEATFMHWTEDDVVVCTTPNYTFFVTENRNLVAHFLMNRYTITVVADPIEGGEVYGGGTYDWGENISVWAMANQFHNFVKWTENDVEITLSTTFPFDVERNRILVAHFEPKTYTVNVSAFPVPGGNAWGGGPNLVLDETITVHAVAAEHYVFVDWTEDGQWYSYEAEYTFPVTRSRDLVANFTLDTFNVYVSADPPEGGTVTGGGYNFPYGTVDTVTATPNLEYIFLNWTEENVVVSEDPEYEFGVTHTRYLVAHFGLKNLSVRLTAEPNEGGTVEGGGEQIPNGTTITVKATPNANYVFENWTEVGYGIVSTNAHYTFPVTRSRELAANFRFETYNITLAANPPAGGNVEGGGINIEYGTEITVIATANPFYTFESWTENGVVVCVDTAFTFTVTKSRSLIANFSGVTYPITLIANPLDGGILLGGGDIAHGTLHTVSAASKLGFAFVNWTEGEDNTVVSSTPDFTFTVEGPRTLIANFIMRNHDIFVVANPDEGGTVTGGGMNIPNGQMLTVSAAPNPEWNFINWTKNDTEVSTELYYSFTATESCTLQANFTKEIYTISLVANPPEFGMVLGGGDYPSGTELTVSAVSDNLHHFLYWKENGNVISTDEEYTFTVLGHRTLFAFFEKTTYLVTVSVNDSDYGVAIGGGWYDKNAIATVEAIETTGFQFVNWTIDTNIVSTSKIYEFMVTENVHLVANFLVLDFDTYASTLWDNTFMLNLKKLLAEEYEVIGCKWFKNDIEQKNTHTINEYSYSAGPNKRDLLELAPTYYMFRIETKNHGTLLSTKKVLTRYKNNSPPSPSSLVVYPNPANSGDSFTIENTTEEYPIEVYNQYGVCVKRTAATDGISMLTLDLPTGLYLIRNNEKEAKIVIVGK